MGCGESKHAVATTDSISTSSRLKSRSGKKSHSGQLSKDSKESTSDNVTNIVPDNTNKPITKKVENPVKVSAIEDEKNQAKENAISKNKKLEDGNEQKLDKENIVKPLLIPEIENKEKDQKLSNDSQKLSSLCDSLGAPVVKDDKMTAILSNDQPTKRQIEIKVAKPLVIEVDGNENKNKEMSIEFPDSSELLTIDTNVEGHLIPHKDIVESTRLEENNSNQLLDDQREEQTTEVKIDKPVIAEKKNIESTSVEENNSNQLLDDQRKEQTSEVKIEKPVITEKKNVESTSAEENNSNQFSDDQRQEETSEVKIEKQVMAEKENVEDYKELSVEVPNSDLSSTQTNTESQSLSQENIVQPAIKEDVIKSLNSNIEEKKETDSEELVNEAHEVKEEGFPVKLEIIPKDEEMASQPPMDIITKDN